jgi:hypothetical protein
MRKILFLILLLVAAAVVAEVALSRLTGMGAPVLFDTHPAYGYRPLPNRSHARPGGGEARFNNLALRSDQDWVGNGTDKILFLGGTTAFGGGELPNGALFSSLVSRSMPNYTAGNAAAPGWSVANAHGLVVDAGFMPARYYVSVFTEDDFYRGKQEIAGKPLYSVPPRFALEQWWLDFCWRQSGRRYRPWRPEADSAQLRYAAERSAALLQAMDRKIREQGGRHLVCISPTRSQVLLESKRDLLVYGLLRENGIKPFYIADALPQLNLSRERLEGLFRDRHALTPAGHVAWARLLVAAIQNRLDLPLTPPE